MSIQPEVRVLLVGAAQQVFAARGYRGATTAEIAAVAGVSESALFRHFATKTDLFATAALVPFTEFMTGFAAVWERQRGADVQTGTFMRTFVTELFDHVQTSRDIVILRESRAAARDALVHIRRPEPPPPISPPLRREASEIV